MFSLSFISTPPAIPTTSTITGNDVVKLIELLHEYLDNVIYILLFIQNCFFFSPNVLFFCLMTVSSVLYSSCATLQPLLPWILTCRLACSDLLPQWLVYLWCVLRRLFASVPRLPKVTDIRIGSQSSCFPLPDPTTGNNVPWSGGAVETAQRGTTSATLLLLHSACLTRASAFSPVLLARPHSWFIRLEHV